MPVDLPEFSVSVARAEIEPVVVVNGELDLVTAPQFERGLNDVIASTDGDVVVDLANVTFIDSTGLRVLLLAHDHLSKTDRLLSVRSPSVQAIRLLEICGLRALIEIDRSAHAGPST